MGCCNITNVSSQDGDVRHNTLQTNPEEKFPQIDDQDINDGDTFDSTVNMDDIIIGPRYVYGGYHMILSKSRGSWIHVNYSQQNNYKKKMQYKTVDYYILQQHKDHNYFLHSNSLVNYYILEIEKCKNMLVPDVINTLCHTYYFEYENVYFILHTISGNI